MRGTPRRVTVVGSYIVALVMDMDRLPIEGETVVGRDFHTTFGGKGSNAAVCAARLGAETYFVGKVGRDAFAAEFVAMLKREGVHREKYCIPRSSRRAWALFCLTPSGQT